MVSDVVGKLSAEYDMLMRPFDSDVDLNTKAGNYCREKQTVSPSRRGLRNPQTCSLSSSGAHKRTGGERVNGKTEDGRNEKRFFFEARWDVAVVLM